MDDAMGIVQKWVDDLVANVTAVANECYREAAQELLPRIEADLRAIYQQAADEWYGAYSPRFYSRRGGLYNIMDIETDVGALLLEYVFSGGKMTTDRAGNSLFDKVFIQGWHGGAFDGSTMRYRTPYPGFWRWGRQAVRTQPAYTIFEEKKKQLENTYGSILEEMVLAKIKSRL